MWQHAHKLQFNSFCYRIIKLIFAAHMYVAYMIIIAGQCTVHVIIHLINGYQSSAPKFCHRQPQQEAKPLDFHSAFYDAQIVSEYNVSSNMIPSRFFPMWEHMTNSQCIWTCLLFSVHHLYPDIPLIGKEIGPH